jgi:isopentenyl diphosphate isomerase/L-lactate dehydrogenase-like FMN-dependent dehydrogenase
MQPNEREETDEEFLARLAANRARRKAVAAAAEEAKKPKLELAVSPKLAEAVKAHPDSLRVSAKAADDTVIVERARPTEIVLALEVDEAGCIARARHVDCRTGDVSIVEYRNGYRVPPGAQHEYNPLDGLRRPEDE